MILSASALVASLCAGLLHGTVTDASGQGVSGATVSLARAGLSTTTAADGSWLLARVAGIRLVPAREDFPRGLKIVDGHLGVDFSGFDPRGSHQRSAGILVRGGEVSARAAGTEPVGLDTLIATLGDRASSLVVGSADTGKVAPLVLDTQSLEVRASTYRSGGLRILSLKLTNQGSRSLDSLSLRLFLNGTLDSLRDLGARVDAAILYSVAGFSGPVGSLSSVDSALRKARPVRMPETGRCDTTASSFTIALPGVVLEVGARLRLDLVLDRHKVATSQGVATVSDDMMNQSPTQDIFTRWSWSTGSHASPTWYPGVPATADGSEVRLLDDAPGIVPVAPYIQILRSGVPLQGIAPACD